MKELIIKELEYAKLIHLRWAELPEEEQVFRGGSRLHKEVAIQKDIIINVLRGDRREIRRAGTLLFRWIERHEHWIIKVQKEPSWIKEAGDVGWHKRWIETYKNVLQEINRKE